MGDNGWLYWFFFGVFYHPEYIRIHNTARGGVWGRGVDYGGKVLVDNKEKNKKKKEKTVGIWQLHVMTTI